MHSLPLPSAVPPPLSDDVTHIWTDGSTLDNGLATCLASAAWVSDVHISDCSHLIGVPISNNVAELAAVLMALSSWPSGAVHVHTDSSFVLCLVNGSLLAMERDGWSSFPWISLTCQEHPVQLVPLFQCLLYLLHSHHGLLSFSWTKGHSADHFN